MVNVISPIRIAKLFVDNLSKSETKLAVFITSKMGSIADNSSGGYYNYRASKAALNTMVKSFSIDAKEIYTLLLHPGWVKTDMGGQEANIDAKESIQGIIHIKIHLRCPKSFANLGSCAQMPNGSERLS